MEAEAAVGVIAVGIAERIERCVIVARADFDGDLGRSHGHLNFEAGCFRQAMWLPLGMLDLLPIDVLLGRIGLLVDLEFDVILWIDIVDHPAHFWITADY